MVLILPAFCQADFKETTLKCPLCKKEVSCKELKKVNSWAGMDYDGCIHALPYGYYKFKIITCPGCLFTAEEKGYVRELDETKAGRIKSAIEAVKAPPGEKAPDIVAKLYLATGTELASSDKDIIEMNMNAAFLLREASWKFPDGYTEIEDIVKKYGLDKPSVVTGKNQTDVDEEKASAILKSAESEKDPVNAGRMRFVAAIYLRKHGEIAKSKEVLKSLDGPRKEDSIIDECLKTCEKHIDAEAKLIESSADLMKADGDTDAYILKVELYRESGNASNLSETLANGLKKVSQDRKTTAEQKKRIDGLIKRLERK